MEGKVFIGTSGWVYGDWKAKFYPEDLKEKDWFTFYAKNFDTVEINNSFYRLPSEKTFSFWYANSPPRFRFAVKMSRYVSAILRLKDDKASTKLFLKNASHLKEKLSVVLVQLPANFKFDGKVLGTYLKLVDQVNTREVPFAYEFRHQSWFNDETYSLLEKYKAALVIADSGRWPKIEKTTDRIAYIRFHGPGGLYNSNYTDEQLKDWAKKIKSWQVEGKTVYAYFNNDINAFAVANAKKLKEF